MFDINVYNSVEPLEILIARPDGTLLGTINNEINETTAFMTVGLNQQFSFTFETVETDNPIYDYIQEGMQLYIPKIGWFIIHRVDTALNFTQNVKNVTAISCDCELENYNIILPINMGTKSSLERIVEYDDDETELNENPYTGVPYDYLVIKNMFPEQLQTLLQKYNANHFGTHGTEIRVSNAALMEELEFYFDLVKRLKNTARKDSTGTIVIEEFVTTEYSYNADGTQNAKPLCYYLKANFGQRIQTLIQFYTKYRKQLSILDMVLEKTGGNWSVGKVFGIDDGDYTLANKKYQFDINENIYSFLTQRVPDKTKCMALFNIKNRTVDLIPAEEIGEDTGIMLSYDNLLNQINISKNDNRYTTRLYVYGDEDIDLTPINFGLPYIEDLSYMVGKIDDNGNFVPGKRDSNGNLMYVDSSTATHYAEAIALRESKRDEYIQSYKKYLDVVDEIYDIKYLVPHDGLKNDWSTFSLKELEEAYTNYRNLYLALLTMYRNDHGGYLCKYSKTGSVVINSLVEETFIKHIFSHNLVPDIYDYLLLEYKNGMWYSGETAVGTTSILSSSLGLTVTSASNGSTITIRLLIKDSKYWWNFAAYRGILAQIEWAQTIYPNYNQRDKWTDAQKKQYDNLFKGSSESWETNWSLFGTVELANKISGYNEILKSMRDAVYIDNYSAVTSPKTVDINSYYEKGTSGKYTKTTDSTVKSGKTYYVNTSFSPVSNPVKRYLSSYYEKNSSGGYVETTDEDIKTGKTYYAINETPIAWNDLTSWQKAEFGGDEESYQYDKYMENLNYKKSATKYLDNLYEKLETKEAIRDKIVADRAALIKSVDLSNPGVLTSSECKSIHRIYRDATYTNADIVMTDIQSNQEKVDTLKELLDDGIEKLSQYCRPQLVFNASVDNLLGLPDFRPLVDKFNFGNFVLVQYDDNTYARLRMTSFTFNPCLPSSNNLTITFSNMIRSKAGISDIEEILGISGGGTGAGSYGGGSGGSGNENYGESDDIDITISNTMLAQLLNTEMFGTRVADVALKTLDTEVLTAKVAKFGGLAQGETIINGKCMQTGSIGDADYQEWIDENATDVNVEYGSIINSNGEYAKGSVINLEDGDISLGNGSLSYNASENSMTFGQGNGSITFTKDDENNPQITFGSDVKLTWDNILEKPTDIILSSEIYYLANNTAGTPSPPLSTSGDYITQESDWTKTIPQSGSYDYMWQSTKITYDKDESGVKKVVWTSPTNLFSIEDMNFLVMIDPETINITGTTDSSKNSVAVGGTYTINIRVFKGSINYTNFAIGDITTDATSGISFTKTANSVTATVTNEFASISGSINIPVTVSYGSDKSIIINKSCSYALIIPGQKGDKGSTGDKGDTGYSVTGFQTIYYLSTSSTSAPSAPSSNTYISSASTSSGVWTTAIPTVTGLYKYVWVCTQTKISNGTVVNSAVTLSTSLGYYATFMQKVQTSLYDNVTQVGSDYIIAPNIGGGFLDIQDSTGNNQVIIDPQSAIKSNDYLIYGKSNGKEVFSIDRNGNGKFSGELSAATGTFAGELNAATGTFNGGVNASSFSVNTKINNSDKDIFSMGVFESSGEEVAFDIGTESNGGKLTTIRIPKKSYIDSTGVGLTIFPYGQIRIYQQSTTTSDEDTLWIGGNRIALKNHSHSGEYLPLSGGTCTGHVDVTSLTLSNGTLVIHNPDKNIRCDVDGGGYVGVASYHWGTGYINTLYTSDGEVKKSDKKVKDHIEYLSDNTNLTDFMMRLKPVAYKLKNGVGRTHYGLYAQDLQEDALNTVGDLAMVKAEVISNGTDEDGHYINSYYNSNEPDENLSWGICYTELIAPIIAIVQKQQKSINELSAEVKSLKAEIKTIKESK